MLQPPPDETTQKSHNAPGIVVYVLHWTIDIETTFVEGVFKSYDLAVKFIEDGIKNQKYPANHWPHKVDGNTSYLACYGFSIEKRIVITSEDMFHLAEPQKDD